MIVLTDELRERVKKHEGFRGNPYPDSVGKLTIGYGRNLDDVGISEKEAGILLEHDLESALLKVLGHFTWVKDLDSLRAGVVVEMAFNMGIGGLSGFKKFLKALSQKDFPTAAREMLDSRWASQVGQRAKTLADIILKGGPE